MDRNSLQVSATILASGLVIAALLVAGAIGSAADPERFVEVKGLAEREVPADVAIWPISYALSADSLEALRAGIDRNDESVVAFLKLNGFSDGEFSLGPPRVTDRWLHGNPGARPAPRYVAERTLTLRSTRIKAVRQAMGEAAELISQGVSLSPDRGGRSEFLFTALEEIKPGMIAEATADARRAARQFAEDSGSSVGAIRRARQGYFSISERDPNSPHVKHVRVVTTIEYALE
ncbi:MAG: SIMPL domain-containing protein [Candidatus Wenzhouxiangella sp. M2_3B_020]